jgi:hypothetical protein
VAARERLVMRATLAAGVLVLGSCSSLYGVPPGATGTDSGSSHIDASPIDGSSPVDGPPANAAVLCYVANHDEDGDAVDDTADDCPTVPGPQAPNGSDQIGSACDSFPGSINTIVLYDPFVNGTCAMTETGQWAAGTGDANSTLATHTASSLVSKLAITTVRVVAEFTMGSGAGVTDTAVELIAATIGGGSAVCAVHLMCGELPSGCVQLAIGSGTPQAMQLGSGAVGSLQLIDVNAGSDIECQALDSSGNALATAQVGGRLGSGAITIAVPIVGTGHMVTLQSVIAYGGGFQ